jgi:hypothetical protein
MSLGSKSRDLDGDCPLKAWWGRFGAQVSIRCLGERMTHLPIWAVAALLLMMPSFAAAQPCRLALVLALDVSASMDSRDDRLQREGLARALASPVVSRAFLTGDPVALYAFQWSGAASQTPILPGWVVVDSVEDLAWVARLIAESRRVNGQQPTATGAALIHAAEALAAGPACRARTVDVSSDGESNQGIAPQEVYAAFAFEGLTVNALVVGRRGGDDGSPVERLQYRRSSQLISWFEREVLYGSGAFWIFADGFESYEQAMTAKLLRELALPAVVDRILLAPRRPHSLELELATGDPSRLGP